MSDEEDPEIIADLQLREYTSRARKGMGEGEFRAAITAAATPDVIGQVPCRGRCGAVVDWTQQAEEAFEAWNRVLARRAEAPLDKTRIVFCVACRKRGSKLTADSNRQQVDAIAALVRELRGGTTAPNAPGPAPRQDREREILDKLKKLNHPDVDLLVQSIRQSREAKSKGRSAARGTM